MTNTQFFLTLGIPYFTLVLVCTADTLSYHAAIKSTSKRIGNVGPRLGAMRKLTDVPETQLVDDSHSDTRAALSDLRDEVRRRLDQIEKRLDAIDT